MGPSVRRTSVRLKFVRLKISRFQMELLKNKVLWPIWPLTASEVRFDVEYVLILSVHSNLKKKDNLALLELSAPPQLKKPSKEFGKHLRK